MPETKRRPRREREDRAPSGEAEKTPATAEPQTVQFDYIKSNLFRVVHVDGVFGGLAPNGRDIHLAAFSQRLPFPTQAVHEVEDGRVGKELAREGRSGLVRELEVVLAFDASLTRSIIDWLERRLADLAEYKTAQKLGEQSGPETN
jgi:hypothetical protein